MTIDAKTYAISMVRGDSEAIYVKCSEQPFEIGDIIEFTVRKKVDTEQLIHIIVDEFEPEDNNAAYIEIKPSDTSELKFGDYVYDIQLTRANGWVTTVIPTAKFTLKTEVTYNG